MVRLAKVERKVEFLVGGGEIKATNDQKGIVEGYLNFIGNIDFGDDRTMPGAFKRTISDSYARKTQQSLAYLWPYLWNHDYSIQPAGGIFEANEDRKGLYIKTQLNLDIQLGRELYASFKGGFMKKQSMGYRAVTVEWVKDDETKRSIRNLLEVAVMEGSACVFPMNDLAQVDTIKNRSYFFMNTGISTKAVCGDTSLPIGARDASWDGSAAHNQIVAWATDSDGNVDASKMKQVHLQVDGDASKITSYGYAFCNIVNGKPQINVGGVKACAGALSGARGASPGSDGPGMRRKVATLYARINKKYPDDPPLVPPWGKGNIVNIHTKDYAESYQQTNQSDWISDLWNLWYPLRNEILTAFQTGDTIEQDVQNALDQFGPAVMAYVQRGIELNMTDCMQPSDDGDSGGGMMPMMMSADDNPETKDVKLLSAASHAKMTKSIDGAITHLKEAKSELSRQRANQLQGYRVYSAPQDDLEHKEDEPTEEEELDEAAKLNKLRATVYDLATTLEFTNAAKGF